MKKSLLLGAALFAGMALTANAQSLNNASIDGGKYLVEFENPIFYWNLEEIQFNCGTTNLAGYDVANEYLKLAHNGNTYDGYVILTHVAAGAGFGQGEGGEGNNAIMVMMWDPDLPISSSGAGPEPGEYVVTIPEGLVALKSDPSVTNAKQDITVQILEPAYIQGDETPTPGTDHIYLPNELKEVTVTWRGASLTYTNETNITYTIEGEGETSIEGGNNAPVHVLDSSCITQNASSLVLNLSGLSKGQYNFRIPATYVILNGNSMGLETTFTYVISEVPTFEGKQTTPEESNDTELQVIYSNKVQLGTGTALFSVNDYFFKNGKEIPAENVNLLSTTSGTIVTFDLADLLEGVQPESKIYVKVPQGMFVNNDGENQEQIFEYIFLGSEDQPGGDEPGGDEPGDEPGDNPGGDEPGDEPGEDGPTDGVAGIQADVNGNFTVYTLQGVKVMQGADLNGLNKGIYIINGKKVVKK